MSRAVFVNTNKYTPEVKSKSFFLSASRVTIEMEMSSNFARKHKRSSKYIYIYVPSFEVEADVILFVLIVWSVISCVFRLFQSIGL